MTRVHAERAADARADAALAPRRAAPDRTPLAAAPRAAAQGTFAGGRPLDAGTGAAMKAGFGWDFAAVRVHDDREGEQLASGFRAHAATLGTHIAFAPGRYRPDTPDGRKLLAHELAHVVQQQHTGPALQLQGDGTSGPDTVVTSDWEIGFKQYHPTDKELDAAPAVVLTETGLSGYAKVLLALANDPLMQAQVEGNASIDGDAEANLRISARRAEWVARKIKAARMGNAAGHTPDCVPIGPGEYACGSMHAHKAVDPADRRATVRLFHPTDTVAPDVPAAQPARVKPAPTTTTATTAPKTTTAAKTTTAKKTTSKPTTAKQTTTTKGGTPKESQKAKADDEPRFEMGIGPVWKGDVKPGDTLNRALFDTIKPVLQAYAQYTAVKYKDFNLVFPIQAEVDKSKGTITLLSGISAEYGKKFGKEHFEWKIYSHALTGFDPKTIGITTTGVHFTNTKQLFDYVPIGTEFNIYLGKNPALDFGFGAELSTPPGQASSIGFFGKIIFKFGK